MGVMRITGWVRVMRLRDEVDPNRPRVSHGVVPKTWVVRFGVFGANLGFIRLELFILSNIVGPSLGQSPNSGSIAPCKRDITFFF